MTIIVPQLNELAEEEEEGEAEGRSGDGRNENITTVMTHSKGLLDQQ